MLFAEQSGEKSPAQITAFEDTWHWSQESEHLYHETIRATANRRLADLLQAFRSFLGTSDMMAYLTMGGSGEEQPTLRGLVYRWLWKRDRTTLYTCVAIGVS